MTRTNADPAMRVRERKLRKLGLAEQAADIKEVKK
jgi:hypothetical protein